MGCDLFCLQMHGQSPVVSPGFRSSVPKTYSTFCLSQNQLTHSLSVRPPLSNGALRIAEDSNREVSRSRIEERIRPWHELKELQGRLGTTEVEGDQGITTLGLRSGLESPNGKDMLKWYSEILKSCAAEVKLREGKVIHGHIVRSGVELDSHLWVSLINFYAKCRTLEYSFLLFEEMPVKDVVAWTTLISGFVAQGYGPESVELFYAMMRDNVMPNEFTLATVLKGCSMSLDLEFGKQLHGLVVKIGVLFDVYIGSALIDLYTKCGEMGYVDDVFCIMPEKNAVLWNALLNGYAQAGCGRSVLRLFCAMAETEMSYSNYTLSIVLKGIASSGALRAGRAVHSMVVKMGGGLDEFVICSLLNMYSKCGEENDALKLFRMVKNPDVVAWSSIISVLEQQGLNEEAAKLFFSMRCSGMRPNQFTLSSLVSAAADLDNLRYGQSIHACAHKFGFESDDLVSNALIGMYMKFQSIKDGCHIFDKIANCDVVSWNALLSGFHDETSDEGFRIFRHMLTEGLRPNMYSYISTLRSCSSSINVEHGRQVHSHIIKDNSLNSEYIGTALIDMYAKCGSMDDVETIFDRFKNRDVFTWTVLISGYSHNGQGEKAVHYFNQMRREGVIPNEFTLASYLKACSGIANLQNGQSLHSLTIKSGHSSDIFVASSLVDMYSKCGCIDDAESLFISMQFCDTVLWNSIICGYSQHGEGDKALRAFRQMVNQGVLPDGVTFVGILSACSHMGLVEEGRKNFNTMRELYGISPTIEHYACLVDILGRAGKFNEIERLIESMEVPPNALIWENVLGACRLHGNVELGEKAADKLFLMDPGADSNYILLSNLYASRGRWSDVSKVRASMSAMGIKKEPGCSWVEVDAQVHAFVAQDVSHPSLTDIRQKLEELQKKVSELGYVPNTLCVLQNVTDREKRENLFNHSERLALGFALISQKYSGKIRIFKNLRICVDCHEFMKFVSSTINQEITIRDTSRFHLFRHGLCSCRDYW